MGLPVWLSGSSCSLLEWKGQFQAAGVGGTVPGRPAGLARHRVRMQSMTRASSPHPKLKSFGGCLLFVGFAFCWWFCLIGSFACFYLAFTLGSQLVPPANNLLSSRRVRVLVWIEAGASCRACRTEVRARLLVPGAQALLVGQTGLGNRHLQAY